MALDDSLTSVQQLPTLANEAERLAEKNLLAKPGERVPGRHDLEKFVRAHRG